jgi:hypothetical protein
MITCRNVLNERPTFDMASDLEFYTGGKHLQIAHLSQDLNIKKQLSESSF